MIGENIADIRRRVAEACLKAERNPSDVTLVAISKTFPATAIEDAVIAGASDIGENYVQELLQKKEALSERLVRWHFVGHLQSNKVKYIAEWIHLIHSVDSVSVAREIDKGAQHAHRTIEVLIEVNTTGEQTKYGLTPDTAIGFVKSLSDLEHVRIAGLMTIGPFLPDPEASRPMFRTLRLLKEEISLLHQSNVQMNHLSMGMTGDFEVAIEEGATLIRIGTAIFGKRVKRA